MPDEIQQAFRQNLAEFFEHGPGLRTTTRTWVAGRDRTNGYVLLSGLGGMGIGMMWFKDDEDSARAFGYEDAPDVLTKAGKYDSDRIVIGGDWDAAFARTAMGMMRP